MSSITYITSHLTFEQRVDILNRAHKLNTKCWVDKLDCKISWSRVATNITFEDIMKMFNMSSFFTFMIKDSIFDGLYGDVGFRTSGKDDVDYFLWITITKEEVEKIAEDYNLKINE